LGEGAALGSGQIEGEIFVRAPPVVEAGVRLPRVEEDAEAEEGGEGERRGQAPLAADGNAGAAEEVERRLASDHGEDEIVAQRLFFAVAADEDDLVAADLLELGAERYAQRAARPGRC